MFEQTLSVLVYSIVLNEFHDDPIETKMPRICSLLNIGHDVAAILKLGKKREPGVIDRKQADFAGSRLSLS